MTVASQALTGPAQGPWDKHDGRYTLRVLGFIENRLANALMQTLILWFWRERLVFIGTRLVTTAPVGVFT